jgi:chromosome segregation ATPase
MARFVEAAVVASFLVPALASAQSLAEIAAKEKERRSGKAVKSYTEEDLRRAGGAVPSFATTSPDEAAADDASAAESQGAAGTPQEKSEDEQRAAAEKAWRERFQKASDDVSNTTAEMQQVQTSLNDLTGNYYSARRTDLLNRMESLKQKLASAREALDNLREEGRRSRFRP